MDDQRFSLSPAMLDVAFPFHLALDRNLHITQAGSSIQRLHREAMVGTAFSALFEVATPKIGTSFEAFAGRPRSLFLLRSLTRPGLLLRGQVLHDPMADCLFFVGSPWLTQTSAFASLGLTLTDFAASDAVVDYVLLLQNQSSSLTEARDLAERLHRTAQQLTHQAFHDPLTGLPNRAMLLDHLRRSLEPSVGNARHITVLMLDLDGFKAVNDSYGHPAGDAVLAIIGNRLRSVSREGDIVARFGGDEFALVLEPSGSRSDLGASTADDVAKRVLRVLAEPIPLPSCPAITVPISASIGIAHAHGTETAEDILRNADLAMYSAKAHGKSRYEHFAPAMHVRSVGRLDLANQLRQALDRDEFRLMFQPVLRLEGDRFAGAEALLRWQHPTRGLLLPDSFLAMAEETGLIVSIGAWVLDQACRELRRWQDAHTGPLPLGVAVNLSGRQLEPDFVGVVAESLRRHRLDPDSLTLEITEGLITGEGTTVHETLRALKTLGVWLSIDDFGTGHSSLGRLRDYEFDELKIDRSFVGDLDTGDPTLVATQIAMAHGLGLGVVAEGVETQAQLDYLRNAGCGQVQGYLIARPLPALDIRALLSGLAEWKPQVDVDPRTPHLV
ncbi:MAG: EAL domain-containing protein [Ilumatobacteraceae bacterium]|nr:EAL domain-containing protein [Ilumatobacteraceae bacterium]